MSISDTKPEAHLSQAEPSLRLSDGVRQPISQPLLPVPARPGVDPSDWRNAIEPLPIDSLLVLSLCRLSQTCALGGDLSGAQALYDSLLPYARRTITTASLGGTAACAVAHYLGLLAAVLSRWDDAVAHLEVALQLNASLGSDYQAARTRYAYANVLLARNRADDWVHARLLLEQAVATLRGLDRAHRAGSVDPRDQSPIGEAQAPAPQQLGLRGEDQTTATLAYVLRRRGQYWTVAYQSPPFLLRDMRGLHYIAFLLGRPKRLIHVMDLVSDGNSSEGRVSTRQLKERGLRVSRLEDCDLVLDARARRDYRARLAELQDEHEEAVRNNDLGRSLSLQGEISFITEHLAAAARPGRTSRGNPSPAERARINVRNCITGAINAMRAFNQALSRHLQGAIRTGAFCCYNPDREIVWDL